MLLMSGGLSPKTKWKHTTCHFEFFFQVLDKINREKIGILKIIMLHTQKEGIYTTFDSKPFTFYKLFIWFKFLIINIQ